MSVEIHGPMWQAECSLCHDMMDVRDSEAEAGQDAADHDCAETLIRNVAYRSGWEVTVERADDEIVATYRRKGDET